MTGRDAGNETNRKIKMLMDSKTDSKTDGRMDRKMTDTIKKPLRVMKFGGTSVGDAGSIRQVVEIIRQAAQDCSLVVVVSAMAGVTNRLIAAANLAANLPANPAPGKSPNRAANAAADGARNAGNGARNGNWSTVREIFALLARQHDEAVNLLICGLICGEETSAAKSFEDAPLEDKRRRLQRQLHDLLGEGQRLCQDAMHSGCLTPRNLDAISGLGERLSAPLVAAALEAAGVRTEALEATELLVTDNRYGSAEPWMEPTRARSSARLLPLLQQGIVPVITGFIGATADGVPTTLGRGGSDYSASIFGAALEADEVVIWTDVPGLLTADPKLIAEASTIPEISYHEAAELAGFGAKVLHPKTLRPLVECGIPVWIKDTFRPAEPGTKITPNGSTPNGSMPRGVRPAGTDLGSDRVELVGVKPNPFNPSRFNPSRFEPSEFNPSEFNPGEFTPSEFTPGRFDPDGFKPGNVKALAAMAEAVMIRVTAGAGGAASPDVWSRAVAAVKALAPEVLLRSESAKRDEICLVIHAALKEGTLAALRREFSPGARSGAGRAEWMVSDAAVAMITLVGQNLRLAPGTVARLFAALGKKDISILAAGHGVSGCSMSFVVEPAEMELALSAIHRELELGRAPVLGRALSPGAESPALGKYLWERASAD